MLSRAELLWRQVAPDEGVPSALSVAAAKFVWTPHSLVDRKQSILVFHVLRTYEFVILESGFC